MSESYSMRRELVDATYPQAVERVTEALAAEGFGVITSIDIRETFKNKLDLEFRPYLIMGACNPQLAHRALTDEPGIGLMLPCNVVVEETAAGVEVSMVRPQAMLGIAGSGALADVANEAEERLERALRNL